MFYQVLRAELLKGRRSPVWLAFVVMPLIPAVLGTVNYWANLGLLQSEWYSLWTQHTLFSSFFFMPALLAVYCAWLWRLETVGHNMNIFMTQPVPVWMLYLAKLVMASGAAVLVQGVTVLLFVLSGWMMGLSSPPFHDILSWAGCGALGAVVVCAVQLWLSLVVKSFAPPVAMALMGGIAGLMAIAQGWGYIFPYALLSLGMRANNPNRLLDMSSFLWALAIDIILFASLTLFHLKRRDITSDK